jgi:CRP-like cAMP-binding protein
MSEPDFDTLIFRLLAKVELFRHLERDDMVALLRNATKADYAAGDLVFEEGFEGHSMYVVLTGRFEVFRTVKNRRVHIADILPGDHFGEIALIANRPRTASVRACEDSVALRFTKMAIFSEPRAGILLFRNMARMMAERLVHADEEIILHRTGHHAPAPTESVAATTMAPRIRQKGAR